MIGQKRPYSTYQLFQQEKSLQNLKSTFKDFTQLGSAEFFGDVRRKYGSDAFDLSPGNKSTKLVGEGTYGKVYKALPETNYNFRDSRSRH